MCLTINNSVTLPKPNENGLIKGYKIVVKVNERLLTYTGTIKEIDDNFITFSDKFNQTFSYNKSNIISFEEVRE